MSFERLNNLFKQISSSSSYSSVRSSIEEYFFGENVHLTSTEQEKLVCLCLRKLPDWFCQTPEQIKEIKINFHKYFLRTPRLLKQKQLIDLIINELKSTSNDYFTFLLVDLYEKNYEKLLNELEKEFDIGYIIHVPDRISNIFVKSVPLCFQTKTYFNRLSEYIQQQLITFHYPKMLTQIDTNINFLSKVIHRGAKLGYTEYIWGSLCTKLLSKSCLNDSLWLRLTQHFLLETIDDTLLYTIEHSDAKVLDSILSDRITHLPSLENYLTQTLLFHKKLSIDVVRTILVYLTMSVNRTEKCFRSVFIRFVQLWSQENFIRYSSNDQHFYVCQCICICLSMSEKIRLNNEQDNITMCLLNGIRLHIESTFDYIRRRGQFIGELITRRINLFSQSNQLCFDSYDRNHFEIQMLNSLAEIDPLLIDSKLSDDEDVRICSTEESSESTREKSTSSTSKIMLHDASTDDDDDDGDDDSQFAEYDDSNDKLKCEVEKPAYIRACLADLMATDKVPQLEAALHVLPYLIETHKIECEEIAIELARVLLNYNTTFNIENFHELQLNALVTLSQYYPMLISDYLSKQFYEKNYTINQRSLILKTIQETAKKLSQIDQIQTKIENELLVTDDEDDDTESDYGSWRSIINERIKLKTKYKRKIRAEKNFFSKENNFGNIIGQFFYPLISFIDKPTTHLSLIEGESDYFLLCELLACLGRLCINAQNTSMLNNMIKQFLQVLKTLQKHQDPGVRHAVVYGYACSIVSIGKICHDQDLLSYFIELKQWLDYIISQDTNTEVQRLAKSVRQILLSTLIEITDR